MTTTPYTLLNGKGLEQFYGLKATLIPYDPATMADRSAKYPNGQVVGLLRFSEYTEEELAEAALRAEKESFEEAVHDVLDVCLAYGCDWYSVFWNSGEYFLDCSGSPTAPPGYYDAVQTILDAVCADKPFKAFVSFCQCNSSGADNASK